MSTNNFHFVNTKQIYAINDESDEFYFDIKISDIKENLKKIGFNLNVGERRDENELRDYPSKILADREYGNKKGKRLGVQGYFGYRLEAVCRMAYYEGANLDWNLYFLDVDYNKYDKFNYEDIKEIMDYLFENKWLGGNEEKQIKFSKMIEKELRENLDRDIKKLEKVFEKNTDIMLDYVGSFSNGEAVYRRH